VAAAYVYPIGGIYWTIMKRPLAKGHEGTACKSKQVKTMKKAPEISGAFFIFR
jgi:hypothetical protein